VFELLFYNRPFLCRTLYIKYIHNFATVEYNYLDYVNSSIWHANFGAFMAVIFQSEICAVTLCSVVVGYQRFRGPCCVHLQVRWSEDEGSMDLWNVGILSQHYTASQPRRHRLERLSVMYVRGCNQKFPDWPPGASTPNGRALCH